MNNDHRAKNTVKKEKYDSTAILYNVKLWMIIFAFSGSLIIGAYHYYLENGFSVWMIGGAILGISSALFPVFIIAVIGMFGLPVLLLLLLILFLVQDSFLVAYLKFMYSRLFIIMFLGGIAGAVFGIFFKKASKKTKE